MDRPENHAPGASREEKLRDRYGLTPSEMRLVLAFLSEASIKKAAARVGVTNETARQYIKRIYQKTGTRSQAQLMKILMTAMKPDW